LQIVEHEYGELFPGEVESVHVVHDLSDLNGLCKEYESLKGKMEDVIDDYISKRRRHIKIKRKKVRQGRVHPPILPGNMAPISAHTCQRDLAYACSPASSR
jgi:hypothetical protein